jgi:hypothetical protein
MYNRRRVDGYTDNCHTSIYTEHYHGYYHSYCKMIVDELRLIRKGYEDKIKCLKFKDYLARKHQTGVKQNMILSGNGVSRKNCKVKIKEIDELIDKEKNRYRIRQQLYSKIINKYFKLLLEEIVNGYKYKVRGFKSKQGSFITSMVYRNREKYIIDWKATNRRKQELYDEGYKPEDIFNVDKLAKLVQKYFNEGYDDETSEKLAKLYVNGKSYIQRIKVTVGSFIKLKWFKNANIPNAESYSFKPLNVVIKELNKYLNNETNIKQENNS